MSVYQWILQVLGLSKPKPTPTPVPEPGKVYVRLSVWFNGALTTEPTVTLTPDFTNSAPITGVPDNGRYRFELPSTVKIGWGATIDITETPATAAYNGRCVMRPDIVDIELASNHFDPSGVSLEELSYIRGAMWTETMNIGLGPRPGQDNNIAATDFLWNYALEDRERIVKNLTGLGYTHAVVGPLRDSDGYHGAWSPNDWISRFDEFLDMLQYLWDAGLAPVVFLHPDGWSFEQTRDVLTPLLQQSRAQKLIRIIVPAGWEPARYEWSNATWCEFMKWGRQVMPNALCLLHTVTDVDAPVGTDARGDDNGKDNAEGWRNIAPFIHGWLTQSAAFARPTETGNDTRYPDRTNFQNWAANFNVHDEKSYANRFQNGYAGWPKGSAWGPNIPLKVYAGEYAAYWVFWERRTKEEARTWGDAAMAAGAAGYLDGGTVPVGPGRRPWQVA